MLIWLSVCAFLVVIVCLPQDGAVPFHVVPSIRQTLTESPFNVKPELHVYTDTIPFSVSLMSPLTGGESRSHTEI